MLGGLGRFRHARHDHPHDAFGYLRAHFTHTKAGSLVAAYRAADGAGDFGLSQHGALAPSPRSRHNAFAYAD